MKRISDIEKELKAISPTLSEIKNSPVFEVPHGYFEALPERLLKLVKENKDGGLLPDEEINALSPLIASLKNKTVFGIPDGYFDALPQNITGKLTEAKQEAPVFQIDRGFKNRQPAWLKYAAAAVVTGVVAVSALFFWNKTPDNYSSRPSLSATENDNQQPVLMQLPEVSDTDLATYLSAATETSEWALEEDADPEFADFVFLKMDDSNLGNMLKDIPYEALLNYEEDISGKEVAL